MGNVLDEANKATAPSHMTGDSVIQALRGIEETYLEVRSTQENLSSELSETQSKLQDTESERQRAEAHLLASRAERERLEAELLATRARLEAEAKKVERYKEQSKQLSSCLKDVHRSLFDGNIYSLILKACMTVTGATRGIYATARGGVENLRLRAAVDVDGYPQAPPSEFIKELCRRALQENDTIVCNNDDMSGLPEPSKESERFRNCVTAPVVLMKNFDGIVIVADRLDGDFSEDDVQTLLSVGDQAAVAVENVRLQRELQGAYLATVSMLADAVEAKDPYTHGHCEQVSRYARLTAERLSLTEGDLSLVCYGALLHDVGKIGVSDGILNKPGALSPEERELVRSHVRVGHDLIARVPALGSIADVVLHHHEWYDGSGYPEGLSGDTIPIAARIVCVVDAYCAMITKRSYKEAYSDERARLELERCAGTQFDPKVVRAFLAMLDSPESQDDDDDYSAECGVLPGFGHLRDMQQAVYS